MSMTTTVSGRCTWAGQALRLAADPVETLRAATLLLRGCPSLAVWLAGWLSTEFPPLVLTGHALSAVNVAPVNRFTCGLAAQRADAVLREALTESHGADYADQVVHPLTDPAVRRHSVVGVWRAAQRSRYQQGSDVIGQRCIAGHETCQSSCRIQQHKQGRYRCGTFRFSPALEQHQWREKNGSPSAG